MKLRRFTAFGDPLSGVPPEKLAEFPVHWVAAARRGEFVMPSDCEQEEIRHAR